MWTSPIVQTAYPTIQSPIDSRAAARRRWLLRVGLLAALALFFVMGLPGHAQAQTDIFLPYTTNGQAPLCRFGVNATGNLSSYNVQPLRTGWYVDYQARNAPSQRAGVDYYRIISLEQIGDGYTYSIGGAEAATAAQLLSIVAAFPGQHWLIGNEPDRRFYQNDIEPEIYAVAYHDLYTLIKERDPQARIVAGNIVQPTPLRLRYLDRVLAAYYDLYGDPMPVDAWGFHNFILNEASCAYYRQFYPNNEVGLRAVCWGADIPPGMDDVDGLRIDLQLNDDIDLFKQQIVAFRTWLADNGYRNTPVYLTEYGVLMPPGWFSPDFDAGRVNRFMDASFDYLLNEGVDPNIGYPADDNRLVQRFSWYSTDENTDHNGFLFDRASAAGARTAMGDNYAAYTGKLAEEVDIAAVSLRALGTPLVSGQGVTTVTLEAVVANSGNLSQPTPVEAIFYNGNPAQGGKLIGVANVAVQGCGETVTAQAEWGVPVAGDYTVYVQLYTDAVESDGQNNGLRTSFTFANTKLLLPVALNRPLQLR